MNRVLAAGLLALPLLFASSPTAHAQNTGFPGLVPSIGPWGGCSHLGCGGFCFRFLGAIHQHGPLFNYGPYSGYYPFEPYGPWTSNLQYTGPRGPLDNCGANCGHCGACRSRLRDHFGRRGDDCGGGGCGNWGGYARSTLSNVFHRCHPLAHKCGHGSTDAGCGSAIGGCAGACAGVGSAAATGQILPNTEAVTVEHGSSVDTPVLQAGYPRRER